MPASFYFVDDKNCILVDRVEDTTEEFVIESPNGDGVFDVEAEPIQGGSYIDGNGDRQSDYIEYELLITFYYSSHTMELVKLLEADEVLIPISLTLKDNTVTRCVLTNDEVVYNFLSDNPFVSTISEDYPHGPIELNFATVEPMNREDIMDTFYDTTSDQSLEDIEDEVLVENAFDVQYSGDEFATDEAGIIDLFTSEQIVEGEIESGGVEFDNNYDTASTSSEPLDDQSGVVNNFNV